MAVLAFKQNTAKRVQETKEFAKAAVRRKRQRQREPLLFHNGTPQRPVMIFRTNRPVSGYLSQAAIDALPMGYEPQYANQLLGKIVRGELKRGFWERIRSRFQR